MSPNSNLAKPKLACEIAADRVLAGRLTDKGDGLEASAARELAPGSVIPDLVENNLRQREAVRAGIEGALGGLAGRSKDVIAIVPDAAVRVMLVEFDTLPSDQEEALGVVRFRLKKSLPFDVDKAKVSYHAQKIKDEVRVVAAVAMASVIEDYERAFHDAGFSPGVVLPSTLAALGAANAKKPTLVIKVDAHTTSIAILNESQLQLFRTLENTRGVTITGEQLAEEVYPSVVFFQDTYHLNIEQIYIAGLPESGGAAPALRAQTGADVQELVSSSQLGLSPSGAVPRWRMAGVVGALIS
ncbi:MAG: type IV pilus biogenesis protein PilM [Candidatus Sulfotelmatobacter sp.]